MNKRQGLACFVQLLQFAVLVRQISFVFSHDEPPTTRHSSATGTIESHRPPSNFQNLRSVVEDALSESQKLQRDFNALGDGEGMLLETMDIIQQKHAELVGLAMNVDNILRRRVNTKAVRYLRDELASIQALELEAREKTEKMTTCSVSEEMTIQENSEMLPVAASAADFDELVIPENVFAVHEARIEERCQRILQAAIENLPVPHVDLPTTSLHTDMSVDDSGVEMCASPAEAAQLIQGALSEFSMEKLYDHAANGGWIVHEQTSATYQPRNTLKKETNENSLWWMDYVPDDWIDAMVHLGFDYGSALDQEGTTLIHRLSDLASTRTLSKAAINPPETVLHPLILPGSCWPMQGRSGFLTLALPYGIRLSAVSLDHISDGLLLHGDNRTAPKTVNVVGYPPCSDKNCNGLTYDHKNPFQVLEFEYDLHSSPTQTMFVDYDEGDGTKHNIDQGSCLAPNTGEDEPAFASCRAGRMSHSIRQGDVVAALRFEFLANHGHEDYTCIYRLRVHGEIEVAE